MATKKSTSKEQVLATRVAIPEPAPKEKELPASEAKTPAAPISAEQQEILRRANERAANHEPVETTYELVDRDEAEAKRPATGDELTAFIASDEANIDPTAKKLTKKEIEAQRKAAAETSSVPRPPAPENDIPHA